MINTEQQRETIDSICGRLKADVLNQLMPDLINIGLEDFPNNLFLLAFKEEQILEVCTVVNGKTKKLKTYRFTNFSGALGPKLKEGDKQIPEGIYKIDYLNPNSKFHLSMKINYPNSFDLEKGSFDRRSDLGSDIFIHGKDITTGCIPIGDEAIEELFILVAHVKSLDHEIDIIISPRDFRTNISFPNIDSLEWTDELYKNIESALTNISNES